MVIGKRLLKQLVGRDLWTWPEVQVPHVRLGSDYGGWVVCASSDLGPGSIVYSVGVGEDISFDLALIEKFGCEVIAFDPTPKSIAWLKEQRLPDRLQFYPWGLAGTNGYASFQAPRDSRHVSYSLVNDRQDIVNNGQSAVKCEVYRLSTIMNKLGHEKLDLLKMDIEGAEYEVIADIKDDSRKPLQLLVEFHHGMYGIAAEKTRFALAQLKRLGYCIFSISPTGREYSFLLDSNRMA